MSAQPIELELLRGRELIAEKDPRQKIAVGRTDDTIVVEMTPLVAEVLAKIIVQHQATRELYDAFQDHYDGDLWTHVVVDLLAAKARASHAASGVVTAVSL